jgi:hypothetical protein
MPTMNAGKVMECTAAQAAFAACGTGEGADHFREFCKHFGVAFRHTDETTASRRGSELYLNGQRLNNGRGEIFGDCIVQVPIVKSGAILAEIPISLKGGDSRDISTDIPFIRSAVEQGMPLWCYLLDGEASEVEYVDGVRVDVHPARNLTMRRINVTPLLRECIGDWTQAGDSKATPAFIRENKVGKYTYLRVRVNWNKVPAHYWHDAEPIPFDAGAGLPSPWL